MIKNIKDLTLEEKIGQLIVFGFNEDYFSENLEKLVKEYKLGNTLLFSRNVSSPEKLFELNKRTQEVMMKHLGVPAFISIDQEGGVVTRLYEPATVYPGAMTLGATNDSNNAYLSGLYMADELEAVGVNLNFAPVLDVNNNPLNPVIGVRSFGDKPEFVSEFSRAFIKGMQTKVLATAKHFPGHGDTHLDSHLDLPYVDIDKKRMDEIELRPFKEAIDEGLLGVMSAHIVYKNLTNGYPATMSKEALTDLLRDELGYEGLIITDGMEMKAILDKYGAVEASVLAILAGANLLLYCHYEDQQKAVVKLIKEKVLDGTIPMEVLDERVKRVLTYKQKISLAILNNQYSDIKARVENEEHRAFARKAMNDALTLVRGEVFKAKGKTLFLSQLPKATSGADDVDGQDNTINILKEALPNFTYLQVAISPQAEEIAEVVRLASGFEQIILTTYNSNIYKQQAVLTKELLKLKKELHVISLRNPYDHHLNPEIENYVCLYEYTQNSIHTLKDYLLGNLKPKGKLPIDV